MSVAEEKFSAKFDQAAANPENRGAYYPEDATAKGLALVQAKHKDTKLYWMVDPEEDRIFSAKFFAYGGKVSLGIGETLCQMVKGLTLPEACSLKGEDVERQLRDDPEVPALPESKLKALDNVEALLQAMEKEYNSAKALALASAVVKEKGAGESATKNLSMAEQAWLGLSEAEQIDQVNLVLDEKIRPALMADGGNAVVLKIGDGKKIVIKYEGACGSCGSSVGATLAFIEQTLRNNIYNDLSVIPDTYADMV